MGPPLVKVYIRMGEPALEIGAYFLADRIAFQAQELQLFEMTNFRGQGNDAIASEVEMFEIAEFTNG